MTMKVVVCTMAGPDITSVRTLNNHIAKRHLTMTLDSSKKELGRDNEYVFTEG